MKELKHRAAVFSCLFVLLLLFLPISVWAAAPSEKLPMASLLAKGLEELVELEVSLATGTSKPLKLAPSVATVITAEDLEAMGATTLDEVLETVPGLHVTISNKNAMLPGYSFRGIHTSLSPHVLMLINGHSINQVYTGGLAYGFMMPVNNISRIEVIRGPGSAVYGADAFAGVINVVTKDALEIDGTKTGLRYGSFDTAEAWLQHGGTYGGWDIALSLTGMKSDGDRKRVVDSDLQSAIDKAMGTKASIAPGPLNTSYNNTDFRTAFSKDNWLIRLWGQMSNGLGLGDGVTQTLSTKGSGDYNNYSAEVNYHNDRLLRDTELNVDLRYMYMYYNSDLQPFPPGSLMPIGADGNIDFQTPVGLTLFTDGVYGQPVQIIHKTGAKFSSVYKGIEDHRLRFETGFQRMSEKHEEMKNFGPGILDGTQPVMNGTKTDVTGTQYIYMPDISRNLWHVSLQDEWAFARKWELTAGVRFDQYSDFGSTINPRLALVWKTLDDLTTKLLYGRAFRPPAFAELHTQNNPANHGNQDLKPETIQTVELAFNYRPATQFQTNLNFFAYEVKDLIEMVQDPGQTTLTFQNHKNQEGHGLELEADWLATDTLRLRGNFAFQRSKDKETGEIVPEAPGMKFYANADWKFMPYWSLDAQYFWVGDRHRAASDVRPGISDYDLVNLTLRRKNVAKHLDFALAVRTLFDRDAREPSLPSLPKDYPLEGRNYWAELRYSF